MCKLDSKLHEAVTEDLQRIRDHVRECKALGYDEQFALDTLSCSLEEFKEIHEENKTWQKLAELEQKEPVWIWSGDGE